MTSAQVESKLGGARDDSEAPGLSVRCCFDHRGEVTSPREAGTVVHGIDGACEGDDDLFLERMIPNPDASEPTSRGSRVTGREEIIIRESTGISTDSAVHMDGHCLRAQVPHGYSSPRDMDGRAVTTEIDKRPPERHCDEDRDQSGEQMKFVVHEPGVTHGSSRYERSLGGNKHARGAMLAEVGPTGVNHRVSLEVGAQTRRRESESSSSDSLGQAEADVGVKEESVPAESIVRRRSVPAENVLEPSTSKELPEPLEEEHPCTVGERDALAKAYSVFPSSRGSSLTGFEELLDDVPRAPPVSGTSQNRSPAEEGSDMGDTCDKIQLEEAKFALITPGDDSPESPGMCSTDRYAGIGMGACFLDRCGVAAFDSEGDNSTTTSRRCKCLTAFSSSHLKPA